MEDQVILVLQATRHLPKMDHFFNQIVEEVKPRLYGVPIVCWTNGTYTFEAAAEKFSSKYFKSRNYAYGFNGLVMLEGIESVAQKYDVEKFELVVLKVVDYEVPSWREFVEKCKMSRFYSKISKVRLCYFYDTPQYVSSKFLRAFSGLPMRLQFIDADLLVENYSELQEISPKLSKDQILSNVDQIAKFLFFNDISWEKREKLKHELSKLEEKMVEIIIRTCKSRPKPILDKDLRSLIEHRSWKMIRKLSSTMAKDQALLFHRLKFQVAYDMLERRECTLSDLLHFLPTFHYWFEQISVQELWSIEDIASADFEDLFDGDSLEIENMDPEAPIIHCLGYSDEFPELPRRQCHDCPFHIFEHMNIVRLNDKITCYKRAKDFRSTGSKWKRRGVLLHNFSTEEGVDLFNNKLSALYEPKTYRDELIRSLTMFVGDVFSFNGYNKALYAVTFLFALYLTDKVQNDEFIKDCVRYTIIRLSLVFKCNLPVFQSAFPHISVSIYDALMYALHVSSTDTDKSTNFYHKLGAAGPYFIFMMDTIFKERPLNPVNIRDYLALDYMSQIASAKGKEALETVAITKVRGWVYTPKGLVLLRGKPNERSYNELLEGVSGEDVYKLKEFVLTQQGRSVRNLDFSLSDIEVLGAIPAADEKPIRDDIYYKHVQICAATCRPILTCCRSGRPWKECIPAELQSEHLSFFNLYGRCCASYRRYTTEEEFLAFLAKRYPIETFYENTLEILAHVIHEFKKLNLEAEVFLKRFSKSKNFEKRAEAELSCQCRAHADLTILTSSYVLAVAFSISVLFICLLLKVI